MAEREEETCGKRPLAVLDQLANRIINGGDVVSIEGVAQTEEVRQQGGAKQRRLIGKRNPCPKPSRSVRGDQDNVRYRGLCFDVRRLVVEWVRQKSDLLVGDC